MFKFKGGIHPNDFKITKNTYIQDAPIPTMVIIPLQQHIGSPAVPLVKVGDIVKTGQKIGEAKGNVSVPVHASITGVVKDIKNCLTPIGVPAQSIVIEARGEEQIETLPKLFTDYYRYDSSELTAIIKEAGIVGLGGASFPTHVKLSPPANKPILTVIANGAECEPFLTSDHRLMIEYAHGIIEGLKIVLHIVGADKGAICIEDNKTEAILVMRQEAAKQPNMEVCVLKTRYPQGAEKQLIYSVTGRKVPPGGLPMDVECVVDNVGTLYAIKNAFLKGRTLTERIVTVTGDNLERPANLRVRIGTPIRELLNFCGWNGKAGKIISGGPMMGITQTSIDVPVIKSTSGILVLDENSIKNEPYSDCIKCGRCIKNCPMNLMPCLIQVYSEKLMWEQVEKLNVSDCIECGCCSYECPAKLPIVQSAKWAKVEIRKMRSKAKNG
ncbi:MAG: electron transport complex subunit RsxC [Elusimicrobiota bacterium]